MYLVLTAARSFLSWWFGELRAMWLPLHRLVQPRRDELTLNAFGEQWSLRLRRGRRVRELGRVSVASRDEKSGRTKTELFQILKKAKLRRTAVKVLLPPDKALRKRLDMPPLAERDLRQALYFEIDRQTPFRSDDVYFDYRIVGRRPEAKAIILELATVPRSDLDEILSRMPLRPSVVDIASSDDQHGSGFNLLKGLDSAPSTSPSPLNAVPTIFVVALLGAVFYLPLYQLAAMDESLSGQLAEESGRAKRTLAMRDELDQAVRASQFLDERKKHMPGMLKMLDELTKTLPDNTWLFSITCQNSEVKISGYSAQAANLISLIGTHALFKSPAFSSPVMQDTQKKLERFDISFKVEQ